MSKVLLPAAGSSNYMLETVALTHLCRNFLYTSTVSSVNGGHKTAEYFGCTSIYPASAGVTTVFVEGDGFTSDLDGTPSNLVSVSGPVTMWAQPITVAFQKSDLSLFAKPTGQGTGGSTATSTSTAASTSTTTTSSTGTTLSSATNSPLPSTRPSSGLSHGTIAGIAIGAAAVLGFLIGGAIFLQRKQKSAPSLSDAHNSQSSDQDPMQGHLWQQGGDPRLNHVYAERQYNAMGQNISEEWWGVIQQKQAAELSSHADRRYELG